MCDAAPPDSSAPAAPASGKLTEAEHGRQKRLAVGAVTVFASVVVVVVASYWPSACERAGRHLCQGMNSSDCATLVERIQAQASAEECKASMQEMRDIDANTKGDARRYRYLGVAKSLVGERE